MKHCDDGDTSDHAADQDNTENTEVEEDNQLSDHDHSKVILYDESAVQRGHQSLEHCDTDLYL